MKCKKAALVFTIGIATLLFLATASPAQMELGDYTGSGSIEACAMPSHRSGNTSKLEEYRDLPETVVVPV